MSASFKGVYDRLLNRILLVIVTNAIKTFLASFLILFIFYFVFTRHISKISKNIQNIKPDVFKNPIELDRIKKKKPDELDDLVSSLNQMLQRWKAAERDIKESEQKYRSLVENANEAISVTQGDRVILCNSKTIELTGYTAEELGSKSFLDFIHPEDRDFAAKEYTARIEGTKKSSSYSLRIITKSNEIKWVIVNSALIEWEGKPASLTLLTDITEQKNIEKALQLSERRLSLIFESVAEILYYIRVEPDDSFHFVSVNPAFLQASGLKRDQIVGKSVEEVIPEKSVQLVLENYRKSIRENRIVNWEETSVYPSGEKTGIVSIAPVFDERGICTHLVGSVHDITDRKLAEQALIIQSRLLEESQRIAQLGSWEWNVEENTLAWSDEVYRIFGIPTEEFGASYEAFLESIHEDDRKEVMDTVNKALSDPSFDYNIRHRVIRPDGIERIVRERGKVSFGSEGKPYRMIGTVQDITEIRRMEIETHKLRTELFQVDRLGMMGVVSAGIAHEINQPLAAILSNAQAALRFLDDDMQDLNEVKEALKDIVSDDKRAGEIVRGIRRMVGKAEYEHEQVDLNEAVSDVLSIVRGEIALREITLSENLQQGIPTVLGNRINIQQVILNLVMNALEAVEDYGEGSSEVIVATKAEGSKDVVFSVSDTGPGIDPGQITSIFDSFYTTKTEGLGVGLSICKTIAREHGGKIWAENRTEGGATLFFSVTTGDKRNDK